MRRPAGEPRDRRAVLRRRWSATAAPTPRRARAPRWRRGVVPPLGPPLSLPSPFAPRRTRGVVAARRALPFSLRAGGLLLSGEPPPSGLSRPADGGGVPRADDAGSRSSPPLASPPCPHLTCTPSRHARSDAPPVCRAPRAPTISSRRPRRAAANDHSPSASRDAPLDRRPTLRGRRTRCPLAAAPPPAPVRRRCGTRGLLRTRGADRRPGRASSRRTRDKETAAGGFIVLGSATRAIKQAGSHRQGQFPFTRRVRERHESQQP